MSTSRSNTRQHIPVPPAGIALFPTELLELVFIYLPRRTLFTTVRLICKRWTTIIENSPQILNYLNGMHPASPRVPPKMYDIDGTPLALEILACLWHEISTRMMTYENGHSPGMKMTLDMVRKRALRYEAICDKLNFCVDRNRSNPVTAWMGSDNGRFALWDNRGPDAAFEGLKRTQTQIDNGTRNFLREMMWWLCNIAVKEMTAGGVDRWRFLSRGVDRGFNFCRKFAFRIDYPDSPWMFGFQIPSLEKVQNTDLCLMAEYPARRGDYITEISWAQGSFSLKTDIYWVTMLDRAARMQRERLSKRREAKTNLKPSYLVQTWQFFEIQGFAT
ncbi:hypothetical protein ABW19_dt0208802 [Dactylella cylindrospora]|nr:hypothetical protein ABW19_dt0208802 [Dactylella cylindrospora]